MAHAQKPNFVFRRNGRVHLNRPGESVQSTIGSRGVRISGTLSVPLIEIKIRLLFPPSHTIFYLPDNLPQTRGAQTCTPPPDPLPPSPTTPEPKRNDPRPGYHIARPPPYIITHSSYLMCIGPMMRSQHPPHTNNSL